MSSEHLISHCALNQITYIMSQMKKELELFQFYSSPHFEEKHLEYKNFKHHILANFSDTHCI